MKRDYAKIARSWFEGPAKTAADLAGLLEAAFKEGQENPSMRGGGSKKQEEELTRRTIKILGPERSLVELKKVPHKRRAVAAHAKVEPEELRDFLEDQPVGVETGRMIRKSLRELGFFDVAEGERL